MIGRGSARGGKQAAAALANQAATRTTQLYDRRAERSHWMKSSMWGFEKELCCPLMSI